jgi:hypothetical protein
MAITAPPIDIGIASEERARFRGVVGKIVQAWTGL